MSHINSIEITSTIHTDVYPAIDPRKALAGTAKGKNVLVTGSGRGIGKAIATAFAVAGAPTIILTARSQHELDSTREEILSDPHLDPPPKILAWATDVTSIDSVDALFAMLDREGVVIDTLITNAGYVPKLTILHEMDPVEWWSTYEVNVKGTFLPIHAMLRQRAASGTTSPVTILCTSSTGAMLRLHGLSAYGTGKSAINRLAEYIDLEYRDQGVRAFAFHPGTVLTRMSSEQMPASFREFLTDLSDSPDLAGGFCVWLATQSAADPYRGKYLSCRWDVDEMVALAAEKGENPEWLLMRPVTCA